MHAYHSIPPRPFPVRMWSLARRKLRKAGQSEGLHNYLYGLCTGICLSVIVSPDWQLAWGAL